MSILKGLLLSLIASLAFSLFAIDADAKKKTGTLKVMTRNLYLGADLAPGLEAASLSALSQGAGQIYRSVGATRANIRMKAVAREIRRHNPDLVALQEVALWRQVTPPNVYLPTGDPPIARQIRFDFLDILLKNLNRKKAKKDHYRALVVTPEFDFEAPADIDNKDTTCYPGNWSGALGSSNGCTTFPGADLTGRLTMRDVILGKKGTEVRTTIRENFSEDSLYQAQLAGGINVPVTRGWNAVDVSIRKSPPLRFVNTHLEAFADPEGPRCDQAREVYREAVAGSPYPVVLAGDLNSDNNSVDGDPATPELDGDGGERCAYLALEELGLRSVTEEKVACCMASSLLDLRTPGEFSIQIDHILSNSQKIRPLGPTRITGARKLAKEAPLLASDHLGVVQRLRIK